jgi:arginine-tRNA-protein transferase
MAYKARFSALEVFFNGEWRDVDDLREDISALHPLSVRPITEQVAAITLPPEPGRTLPDSDP